MFNSLGFHDTDSQVVLSWVRNQKQITNKFVAKRITKIRSVIDAENIHYVRTDENPADPPSRGLSAEQLASCDKWFQGPAWLHNDILPTTPKNATTVTTFTTLAKPLEEVDLFKPISSWSKLIRTIAICLRWKNKKVGHIII